MDSLVSKPGLSQRILVQEKSRVLMYVFRFFPLFLGWGGGGLLEKWKERVIFLRKWSESFGWKL